MKIIRTINEKEWDIPIKLFKFNNYSSLLDSVDTAVLDPGYAFIYVPPDRWEELKKAIN